MTKIEKRVKNEDQDADLNDDQDDDEVDDKDEDEGVPGKYDDWENLSV